METDYTKISNEIVVMIIGFINSLVCILVHVFLMLTDAWDIRSLFFKQFCSRESGVYKWVKLQFNIEMEKIENGS